MPVYLSDYIEKVLGQSFDPRRVGELVALGPVGEMAVFGYPNVHYGQIYLGRSIEDNAVAEVPFPDRCCVCFEEAATLLPLPRLAVLEKLLRFRAERRFAVPHCREHGQRREAAFLLRLRNPKQHLNLVECCGLNRQFIEQIWLRSIQSDFPPPWEVFAGAAPDSFQVWRSDSLGQDWLLCGWFPFWERLSAHDRRHYLETWHAPSVWQKALLEEGWADRPAQL